MSIKKDTFLKLRASQNKGIIRSDEDNITDMPETVSKKISNQQMSIERV